MKQITEDFVSYEIAKFLKDKGFDVPTFEFYEQEICGVYEWDTCNPQFKHSQKYKPTNWNDEDDDRAFLFSCPTHQMALKFLREVHNLHITIKPYITEEGIMYLFEIYKLEAEKFTLIKTETGFEKSELADEAAIKYSLENLI